MPHETRSGSGESDGRVLVEQVDNLYARLPIALITVIANSALLAYVMWGSSPSVVILGWLGTTWAIALGRVALLVAYRRTESTGVARRWGARFSAGALANGIAWGSTALLLYPAQDSLQVFLAFVLGGMTAGDRDPRELVGARRLVPRRGDRPRATAP